MPFSSPIVSTCVRKKAKSRANGDDGVCSSLVPLTHNGLMLLTGGKPMRVLPLLDRMTTHIIDSHNPIFHFQILPHFRCYPVWPWMNSVH